MGLIMFAYAAHGGKCGSVHQPGLSSVSLKEGKKNQYHPDTSVEIHFTRKSEGTLGNSTILTCALQCHLFSLSLPMLFLYLDLNQAVKSPNHVSLPV